MNLKSCSCPNCFLNTGEQSKEYGNPDILYPCRIYPLTPPSNAIAITPHLNFLIFVNKGRNMTILPQYPLSEFTRNSKFTHLDLLTLVNKWRNMETLTRLPFIYFIPSSPPPNALTTVLPALRF